MLWDSSGQDGTLGLLLHGTSVVGFCSEEVAEHGWCASGFTWKSLEAKFLIFLSDWVFLLSLKAISIPDASR